MSLIECPDCQKQISDQAPTCIHCGRPMHTAPAEQPAADNSNIRRFTGYLKNQSGEIKYETFFGSTQPAAETALLARNPGWIFSPHHEIAEAPAAPGKYSCPSCKAKFTSCQKKIGCAIMIIIFISLGLGLIMIPFLPHHCECQVCGHRWKS